MPWFFYKSGSFYKKTGVYESIKYDMKKLLLPYVVFTLYAYVIQVVCMLIMNEPLIPEKLIWEQLNSIVITGGIPWNVYPFCRCNRSQR